MNDWGWDKAVILGRHLERQFSWGADIARLALSASMIGGKRVASNRASSPSL